MNWSQRLCAAMVTAAAFIGTAGAASLTTVGQLNEATRPAGVPLNYVITPNGLFHPSCVVAVADGQKITAQGAVLRADGSVAHEASPCAYPRFVVRGNQVTSVAPDGQHAEFDGWIAASDSNANVTPPAKRMLGNMIVPSGPTSKVGQVLYYFPGLEDGGAVQTILQPVLAWNGFNDSRWTQTNWNCCKSGKTWHGSTIPVNTGDKIKGSMMGSNCTGNTCATWVIKSTDKNTGQSTTFSTEGYGQAFDWYFGGAKEAYGVSACTHFPANGSIRFTGIHVYDMNGIESTPAQWDSFIAGGAPACNYVVTTTPNQTTITFKASQ